MVTESVKYSNIKVFNLNFKIKKKMTKQIISIKGIEKQFKYY